MEWVSQSEKTESELAYAVMLLSHHGHHVTLPEQCANVETMQRNIAQIRQSLQELPSRNHLLHAQAQRETANLNRECINGTVNATTLIKTGDEVILRYRAFPYQNYGHQKGKVAEVAKNALTPRERAGIMGEAATQESFYRVIVKLEDQTINALGRPRALRPGMDVDAKILGQPNTLEMATDEVIIIS